MKVFRQDAVSVVATVNEVDEVFSDEIPSKKKLSVRFLAIKRTVDIIFSLLFFLLFGWLCLLLWLVIVISSGFPGIYAQERYGKHGRVFKFYKFRSMVKDSDAVLDEYLRNNSSALAQWNVYQKLDHDPRITKVGALIRKTSLDELPQFWNVLIGDMSLVGPRPCMVSQKELYRNYWFCYCMVRPGITGLWQVSGRNNLNFSSRVALDVKYVCTISILNDLRIFWKTIGVVLTGDGSR